MNILTKGCIRGTDTLTCRVSDLSNYAISGVWLKNVTFLTARKWLEKLILYGGTITSPENLDLSLVFCTRSPPYKSMLLEVYKSVVHVSLTWNKGVSYFKLWTYCFYVTMGLYLDDFYCLHEYWWGVSYNDGHATRNWLSVCEVCFMDDSPDCHLVSCHRGRPDGWMFAGLGTITNTQNQIVSIHKKNLINWLAGCWQACVFSVLEHKIWWQLSEEKSSICK